MTWLAQHWMGLVAWLAAAAAGIWAAVQGWRLRKAVQQARTETVFARVERDTAQIKARDAELEAQATREQAKALGLIDKEAKDARARGGSLADDLAKLNREANTPPGGIRRP